MLGINYSASNKNIFKSKEEDDDIILYTNVSSVNSQERFNFLVQFNDIVHYKTEPHSEFEYDVFKV